MTASPEPDGSAHTAIGARLGNVPGTVAEVRAADPLLACVLTGMGVAQTFSGLARVAV